MDETHQPESVRGFVASEALIVLFSVVPHNVLILPLKTPLAHLFLSEPECVECSRDCTEWTSRILPQSPANVYFKIVLRWFR